MFFFQEKTYFCTPKFANKEVTPKRFLFAEKII